jgi:hypothetical protein
MGGMLLLLLLLIRLLIASTVSTLSLSTRSLSSSTVVWMEALCSPRPEEDVGSIGVNIDV